MIIGDGLISDPYLVSHNPGPFEFWEMNDVMRQKLLNIDDLTKSPMSFGTLEKFWGYMTSRINLCRDANPNQTMLLLKELCRKFEWTDTFVVTQNDHGMLFKAGFEED